jgi:ADP-heptose:LPS heptosyltransferase
MKNRYYISKNWVPAKNAFFARMFIYSINYYLSFHDFITFLAPKKKTVLPIKNPKKILISNIACLGDVIITTSVIPVIKKHYPNSKLFFLGASSTELLLKNHHLIDGFFSFNHYRINRRKINLFKKIINHLQTKRLLIKQLKKENIDLAIDFYFYNPNSIKLLHKAKIPNIIGYTNCGFKNLLTLKVENHLNPFWHMSEYHLDLLNLILEKKEKARPLEPSLPLVREPTYKQLKNYENKKFILIHTGAGQQERYLDQKVTQKLLDSITKDYLVLFIGLGEEEKKHIEKIINGYTNCINLSNKLNILDIIYLCNRAEMVMSTDSSISHLASSFNNPQTVFFRNVNFFHQQLWLLKKQNIKMIQM